MSDFRNSHDLVLVSVADRIATITLNRPEWLSSLVPEFLARLPSALAEIERRQEASVVMEQIETPEAADGTAEFMRRSG